MICIGWSIEFQVDVAEELLDLQNLRLGFHLACRQILWGGFTRYLLPWKLVCFNACNCVIIQHMVSLPVQTLNLFVSVTVTLKLIYSPVILMVSGEG